MISLKKIVAIVAIAAATITTASAQLTDAQTAKVRERVQNQVTVMDKKLNLNDGQRSSLREATLNFELTVERALTNSNVEARRNTIKTARVEMDRKVKAILRSEQYTAYMRMADEREAKVQSMQPQGN